MGIWFARGILVTIAILLGKVELWVLRTPSNTQWLGSLVVMPFLAAAVILFFATFVTLTIKRNSLVYWLGGRLIEDVKRTGRNPINLCPAFGYLSLILFACSFGTIMAVATLFAIGKELWAFIRNPHPIIIPAPTLAWLLPIGTVVLTFALFFALVVLYRKLPARWGFGRTFIIGGLGSAVFGALLGGMMGMDPNIPNSLPLYLNVLVGIAAVSVFAFVILSGWGITLLAIRYVPVFRTTTFGQLAYRTLKTLKDGACPAVVEITD